MGINTVVLVILFVSELIIFGGGGIAFGKELAVYYRSPESPFDQRLDFINEIIVELLDRTVSSDGPYTLIPLPKMVFSRLAEPKTQDKYPNMLIRLTGDYATEEHFEIVPIPINRGIVGYRIFLIHKNMQKEFSKISSLADLQASMLAAGQGRWTDVDILEENKLPVIVGNNYEGLFGMLMLDRFDYFPRGVNEVFNELEEMQTKYSEMQIEETIALYYHLPRVLVTNKGNTSFANRVERGLKAIIKDGTHRKIWLKHNQENLIKSNLDKRKVFYLKNSMVLPNLPYNQKEYWYQPGELQ